MSARELLLFPGARLLLFPGARLSPFPAVRLCPFPAARLWPFPGARLWRFPAGRLESHSAVFGAVPARLAVGDRRFARPASGSRRFERPASEVGAETRSNRSIARQESTPRVGPPACGQSPAESHREGLLE